MALGDIWNSLNDACYPILDALHLSGLFEDNHIPPIVFPAAVIAVILLAFFLLSSPAAATTCGNNVCDASDEAACPEECESQNEAVSGKTVIVRLDKPPSCQVTVELFEKGGSSPRTQQGQKAEFKFTGITWAEAYATVAGTAGQKKESQTTRLQGAETVLTVSLSDDACGQAGPQRGTLRLVIKDASSNNNINGAKVSVAELLNGRPASYPYRDQNVNGMWDFPLNAGKAYAIYVEKGDYAPYNGESDPITISSQNQVVSKTVTLQPMAAAAETSEVEVCALNGSEPLQSGLVAIQSASGGFREVGEISEADPATEAGEGCYVFTAVPTGTVISTSLVTAPEGCIPSAGPTITIGTGNRQVVLINATCSGFGNALSFGDIGYLKVKVSGNGTALTQSASVTAWVDSTEALIPGNGISGSLAMGDGNYTEEVVVPAGEPIYVWARGLPSGYLDKKSDIINVSKGQHRAIDLNLDIWQAPLPGGINFTGVSAPLLLEKSQNFIATISRITYGRAQLTPGNSNVTAAFGGRACAASYSTSWQFNCTAPNYAGNATLIFTAELNGSQSFYNLTLTVLDRLNGAGILTITPVFATDGDPPLSLYYDIKISGVPVADLISQDITVTFLDSPGAYPGEMGELEKFDEYWSLTADVPYKGEYRAEITIEAMGGNTIYASTYLATFTATAHSGKLALQAYPSKKVLSPSEAFRIESMLNFGEKLAYGLDILEIYMDGVFYTMEWDNASAMYKIPISAPASESCGAQMRFLINDEELGDPIFIYSIDQSKPKAAICPLASQGSCNSIEELRRCVLDSESRAAYYSEEMITACVASGCGSMLSCSSSNKGDINPDCEITSDDSDLAQQVLTTIESQQERNTLKQCLDMDNDNDVDDADLTCLRNMASGKWFGDVNGAANSNGSCTRPMKGGFCFDIDTEAPLPGDMAMNGRIDVEDEDIMIALVRASLAGVRPNAEVLGIADFNQDGAITNTDLNCLGKFFPIDFSTRSVLPTEETIPSECMEIFNTACRQFKGDLTGDMTIDEMDYIIEYLMVREMTPMQSQLSFCADINSDNAVNEFDLECLDYFFTDPERWLSCLQCDENLPEEAYSTTEICGDGYDNDCDGLADDLDPMCACDATTPCDMKYDIDGGATPGVADGKYKLCRKVNWADESFAWRLTGGWSDYMWMTSEKYLAGCVDENDWKAHKTQCNGKTETCVFDYPAEFSISNYDKEAEKKFKWLTGSGNIGPAGIYYDCHDDNDGWPACPEDWIDTRKPSYYEGGCCNHCGSWFATEHHDACLICRFKYDTCSQTVCGSSGATANKTRCSDAFTQANIGESCAAETSCMGVL